MVEGSHPRRGSADRPAVEDDLPLSAGALEEACNETLTRLNQADSTEEATRLLERLHRLRRALRELELTPMPPLSNGRPVAGAGS
jgi:hypothetical protein